MSGNDKEQEASGVVPAALKEIFENFMERFKLEAPGEDPDSLEEYVEIFEHCIQRYKNMEETGEAELEVVDIPDDFLAELEEIFEACIQRYKKNMGLLEAVQENIESARAELEAGILEVESKISTLEYGYEYLDLQCEYLATLQIEIDRLLERCVSEGET